MIVAKSPLHSKCLPGGILERYVLWVLKKSVIAGGCFSLAWCC